MQDLATKPDLEAIMRKLKEKKEPQQILTNMPFEQPISSNEAMLELKQIAKMLGMKLKTALEKNRSLTSQLVEKEQEISSLQAICIDKDQKISKASQQAQINSLSEDLHQSLKENEAKQEQISLLENKIIELQEAQTLWKTEEALLRKEIQNECSKKQKPSPEESTQVLRIALTCRGLEDEIHALTCEKAATLKQHRDLKEQYELIKTSEEKAARQLIMQEQSLKEREQSLARHIIELADRDNRIGSLLENQEKLHIKLRSLEKNIEDLQNEKATLSASLSEAKDQLYILQTTLENREKAFESLQKSYSKLSEDFATGSEEKTKAQQRVLEVEEVLILKLTSITDLQEQVGLLETALSSSKEQIESMTLNLENVSNQLNELEATHTDLSHLHEKTKIDLLEAKKNNTELSHKTQRYESLKHRLQEAKAQASLLLKILDEGNTSPVTVAKLVEELSIKSEDISGLLVEDNFEQHDLF